MKGKGINLEARVRNDWHYLKKIKNNEITEKLCDAAFAKSYEAIKYIPNRFKEKYSKEVLKQDWNLYNYCDVKSLTLTDWIEIISALKINYSELSKNEKKSFDSIVEYLIDNFDENSINKYIESIFESEIIKKEYIDGNFIVVKRLTHIYKKITYRFQTFDEFYTYLDGDLSNCDIFDCDFENIDLKKYNIEDVAIKSSVLIKNNMYDNKFYNETIVPLLKQNESIVDDDDMTLSMLHESDVLPYQKGDYIKRTSIYYISDIHLDNKIAKNYKEHATKKEIEYYIKSIVDKMMNSIQSEIVTKYVLIAGDVSSSFEISKMFYEKLVERNRILSKKIICVLGNHELWNMDRATKNDVDDIVKLYRNMFNDMNITFLQNELLIYNSEIEIISEMELEKMSEEELKIKTLESQLTIFGGIGFSGYNPDFNASKLIYCDAVLTLEEDKKYTNKFNNLYLKLKSALYNRRLIILTHHPKQDWSTDPFNPNWIYINGHTHRNIYEKNLNKQLYADNQIGYFNENVILKRIDYSLKCNIFSDYEDGIYNINLEQYLSFYWKMGYNISCKLDGEYILLKKNNTYMFIYKNNKGNIYILNGGRNNKLDNNDINYYYENMEEYSNIIKGGTKSFYEYLKQLSDYIKSIGGSGNIHGTIVDIDFYNHVYVNIYNGKITPYWALSIDYKIIYPDVKELLSNHCPSLLKNIENDTKNELAVIKNELIPKEGEFYEDTRIYKESRVMKQIQYLIDDDIIRIWNDEILKDKEIKLIND